MIVAYSTTSFSSNFVKFLIIDVSLPTFAFDVASTPTPSYNLFIDAFSAFVQIKSISDTHTSTQEWWQCQHFFLLRNPNGIIT